MRSHIIFDKIEVLVIRCDHNGHSTSDPNYLVIINSHFFNTKVHFSGLSLNVNALCTSNNSSNVLVSAPAASHVIDV